MSIMTVTLTFHNSGWLEPIVLMTIMIVTVTFYNSGWMEPIVLMTIMIVTVTFYNSGWLEPLLERVATGEPLIIAPIIDVIFKDTFAVEGTELNYLGGVHLETLEFKWLPLSDKRRNNHPKHTPYK